MQWYVQPSCAVSGDGLLEGLSWLTTNLKGNKWRSPFSLRSILQKDCSYAMWKMTMSTSNDKYSSSFINFYFNFMHHSVMLPLSKPCNRLLAFGPSTPKGLYHSRRTELCVIRITWIRTTVSTIKLNRFYSILIRLLQGYIYCTHQSLQVQTNFSVLSTTEWWETLLVRRALRWPKQRPGLVNKKTLSWGREPKNNKCIISIHDKK